MGALYTIRIVVETKNDKYPEELSDLIITCLKIRDSIPKDRFKYMRLKAGDNLTHKF